MISKRTRFASIVAIVLAAASSTAAPSSGGSTDSQVVSSEIQSQCLANTKAGTDPLRKLAVYLPAGYDGSPIRYPVVYFLPSPFSNYRYAFDRRNAQRVLDRAIAANTINKFIFVCLDMTTPLGASWYVNSPVTGNWEDYMLKEVVPYVDAHFKTLAKRDSRGIAGDFIGAHGAIRLGMRHPEIFGSVYGMHPVGTGSGVRIMGSLPRWDLFAKAKTQEEVKGDVFATIFQAHLPNPDKPPLFFDLAASKTGDQLVIDAKLTEKLRNNFFLESMIPQCAENLKSLRGFKFDWARNDGNYDHVFSNQAFTHKLNEFGIAHEAEEYNGSWGQGIWGKEGRIVTDVLPFFQRHLVFDARTDDTSK